MLKSTINKPPKGPTGTPSLRAVCEDDSASQSTAASNAANPTANARWWKAARALLAAQFDRASVKNVRREALAVFSIRVISAALLFGSQIILARWIGAQGYGLYVALWSAVLVAGGLSHLGLSTAMMRLVPEYRASNAFDHLRGILIGGRFIAVAGGLTAAALGGLMLPYGAASNSSNFVWAAVLALACLPAYALTEAQDGLGRGQGWTLASVAPPYILRPVLILVLAAAAYGLAFPATTVTAMACALSATWITAIVQTVLVQRRIAETVPAGSAAFEFKGWLAVSLPLLAVSGSELVLQNADVLLLNALRSPEEVGIYYAAAKTTCLSLFVHYAVGSAYSGRFATAGALGDRDGLIRLTRESVWWTFWPSLAVTACVLVTGPTLLGLFGRDFQSAYPAMFILSLGLLARAATGPSEFVLNMLGRQSDCARSFAIAACVSIGLNLVLIPWFGAFGAAAATGCAFATASALNWRTARRELGLNLFVFEDWAPRALQRSNFKWLSLARFTQARADHQEATSPKAPAGLVSFVNGTAVRARATAFEIVRDEAAFESLKDDWNRLYQNAAGNRQPFMSFNWNRFWLKHYHTGQSHPLGVQLAVLVGRREGRVSIIWPLVTKRMAGMTYLYWMGQPVSQYGDVLVDATDITNSLLRESWDVILSHLSPDVIMLRKVRGDAAVSEFLKEKKAIITRSEQAPYVTTAAHTSFEDFEQRYSAKARKNRRRLLRRLEETGKVEFVHHSSGDEAAALVKRAIAFKKVWLDQRGLIAPAVQDQRFERFFVAASFPADDSGCCLVSALLLDGEPYAVLVSAFDGSYLAGHIFAYDLQHEKTGAGVLLLENCLQHAVINGYSTVDLLAPGDTYKYDWCDQQVEVNDWAMASSIRGQVFTRFYLAKIREHIRRTAKLLPAPIRKLVQQAAQFRPAGKSVAKPGQPSA